jgi:hypothetical protein
MLTVDDGVNVSWDAGTNEARVQQTTLTPPDIETGFVAMFRQFFLAADDASYAGVSRILHEHASSATDANASQRLVTLKGWASAIKTTGRRACGSR